MEIRSKKRKTIFGSTADPPSCRRRRREVVDAHRLPPPGEWRDWWAALPHDVLWLILSRIPQADILRGASLACSAWQRLAVHEPLLWRRIDLAHKEDGYYNKEEPEGWREMARAAVRRSAGRCESFRGRVDGDFLLYLADSAPLLRSLQVTCIFDMKRDGKEMLIAAMKKLRLLEQLVLSAGPIEVSSVVDLLDHGPRLELLDVSGCHAFDPVSKVVRARLAQSRIKDLRLPRQIVHFASGSLMLRRIPRPGRDRQPHQPPGNPPRKREED